MEEGKWKDFGQYLMQLRKDGRLTLRDVEARAGVSNAYLSMIERGRRHPPHPDILRKLAEVYGVMTADLMRKAGYIEEKDDFLSKEAELERAFKHVISDPEFEYGTRITGAVSEELKRLVVELYEKTTKRKLL